MTPDLSHNEILLRQYAMLPKLMNAPVESDEAMEVLGAILGRDELSEVTSAALQQALVTPDRVFAEALSRCTDAWRECIAEWSRDCGFASAPWWHSVLTGARQLSGLPTTLADLFAPVADVWLVVKDETDGFARELVRRMDYLMEGVVSGVKAVGHGVAGEAWESAIAPTVAYPGSVHIGFLLPRREIGGVPGRLDDRDREAAQRCIDTFALLGAEGSGAGIDDLIPWEETQAAVRKSFEKMRKSLAANAVLELTADAAITRSHALIRNVRPYRRRAPRVDVSLTGVVRMIDLDACRLKLRNDDGTLTTLRYEGDTLIPGRLAPGDWLDRHVRVRAFAQSQTGPPKSADLLEIDLA